MNLDLTCSRCHAHRARIVGIEVQGVYDGVLIWLCKECGHAWPRFIPDPEHPDPWEALQYRTALSWIERNAPHDNSKRDEE